MKTRLLVLTPLLFVGCKKIGIVFPIDTSASTDTGTPTDTSECVRDAEIVSVCECPLTVAWSGIPDTITKVGVVMVSITAEEAQAKLCEDRFEMVNVVGFYDILVRPGETEVAVDTVPLPAFISLWTGPDDVVGMIIADPSPSRTGSTVTFE